MPQRFASPVSQQGAWPPLESRRAVLLVVGFLLLLSLAVYGNALPNPFLIDDTEIILGDYRVQAGQWGALLTGRYWPPPRHDYLYRPLVKVSYALNWIVSHQPWAFRVPNLALHVGAAFVLFLLAGDWVRSFWAGLVAATLFLLHPVHTEPLDAIVGRADLGAAVFGLLAVWLYWRDGVSSFRGRWFRPLAAALCFAAAVLFKESALPMPGVVVLLDAWPPHTSRHSRPKGWLRRRVLRCYLPLLLVVAAYMAARWTVLDLLTRGTERISVVDNVIANPDFGLQPGNSRFLARWGTPLATFGKAVGLLVWPHPLCWDYSYAAIDTVKRPSDPRLRFGLAGLLAIGVMMAISFRRRRVVFAALSLGLVTYGVVSNTLVPIGTVFAERLLYLPSAGFCLLVGGVAASWLQPAQEQRGTTGGRRRALAWSSWGILTVVAGVYAGLTVDRNRAWQSREGLDATDVKTQPRSCRLLSSTATDAVYAEDFVSARAYAERAIAIYPDQPGPWKVLGAVYWHEGSAERALRCLQKCFDHGGAGDEAAVVLATTIMNAMGDGAQAIRVLRQLVEQYPLAATALNNLAWCLLTAEPPELRDPQAALRYAETALRLRPRQGGIIDTCVAALLALQRRDEARALLERSLPHVPPDDPSRPDLETRLKELRTPQDHPAGG